VDVKKRPMIIHPLLRSFLSKNRVIFVESVNMTILVARLTFGIILAGWLSSSDLPLQAVMNLNHP
jgi:hypothetical protein